ncbi:ABC transporter ATP-binding protein [Paracoccus albus]|uniref:ABC transporter ATP-binding protein n=1 Tax=Paracoccus albus TaxID=3017784 RepID=UPI0022F133F4|nr:ATP-binding cassette domain-containing protein [Paracoccus albus]WBU60298.1 ATP-binding cassette domain-containing protein [Paracoccus albus]
MLSVKGLHKSFGGVEVIRDLTLSVMRGERLVILGPNGAGKTTLFRLIAGEITPEAGKIVLKDNDITHDPPHVRARAGLGRSFQQATLFERFTLEENLIIAGLEQRSIGGDPLRDPALRRAARDIAEQVGLVDLERPARDIDHGNRRRLDLGLALAGRPDVLLLDEPASGFGPGGARQIHDLIANLPRDLTIIVIEHDLDLAFSVAERIVVLDAGRIAFDGGPSGARPALKAIYDA